MGFDYNVSQAVAARVRGHLETANVVAGLLALGYELEEAVRSVRLFGSFRKAHSHLLRRPLRSRSKRINTTPASPRDVEDKVLLTARLSAEEDRGHTLRVSPAVRRRVVRHQSARRHENSSRTSQSSHTVPPPRSVSIDVNTSGVESSTNNRRSPRRVNVLSTSPPLSPHRLGPSQTPNSTLNNGEATTSLFASVVGLPYERAPGELNVYTDDLVRVLDTQDADWWVCERAGLIGRVRSDHLSIRVGASQLTPRSLTEERMAYLDGGRKRSLSAGHLPPVHAAARARTAGAGADSDAVGGAAVHATGHPLAQTYSLHGDSMSAQRVDRTANAVPTKAKRLLRGSNGTMSEMQAKTTPDADAMRGEEKAPTGSGASHKTDKESSKSPSGDELTSLVKAEPFASLAARRRSRSVGHFQSSIFEKLLRQAEWDAEHGTMTTSSAEEEDEEENTSVDNDADDEKRNDADEESSADATTVWQTGTDMRRLTVQANDRIGAGAQLRATPIMTHTAVAAVERGPVPVPTNSATSSTSTPLTGDAVDANIAENRSKRAPVTITVSRLGVPNDGSKPTKSSSSQRSSSLNSSFDGIASDLRSFIEDLKLRHSDTILRALIDNEITDLSTLGMFTYEQLVTLGFKPGSALLLVKRAQWATAIAPEVRIDNVVLQSDAKPLGRGHFGEVLPGVWKGVDVACKRLTGGEDRQQVLDEVHILKMLSHPNVVRFFGLFSSAGDHFIVMERMHTENLLQVLQRTAPTHLPLLQLLRIASLVCAGMAYVCKQRVVHRDLAARNILVKLSPSARSAMGDESDQHEGPLISEVKIGDFGLSRSLYSSSDFYEWYAPEVLQARRHTTASDVWSFGVLLWELFSRGRTPYLSVQEVASGRRLQPPALAPQAVCDVMRECWAAEPDRRPPFTDLAVALRQLLFFSGDGTEGEWGAGEVDPNMRRSSALRPHDPEEAAQLERYLMEHPNPQGNVIQTSGMIGEYVSYGGGTADTLRQASAEGRAQEEQQAASLSSNGAKRPVDDSVVGGVSNVSRKEGLKLSVSANLPAKSTVVYDTSVPTVADSPRSLTHSVTRTLGDSQSSFSVTESIGGVGMRGGTRAETRAINEMNMEKATSHCAIRKSSDSFRGSSPTLRSKSEPMTTPTSSSTNPNTNPNPNPSASPLFTHSSSLNSNPNPNPNEEQEESVDNLVLSELRSLRLEYLAPLFAGQGVDFHVFMLLTNEDLIELGVQKIGHKRLLLNRIEALRMKTTENSQ